ncbi:MAG: hypothetical protein PHR35_14130 [Kiritimatiellae bacterium]|nr:hypothetical protein [Kiritimatiellia bacterium]
MNACCRVFCLSAVMACAVAQRGVGDCLRTIRLEDDARVAISIAWSFPVSPDACLILREQVPAGWRFAEYEYSGGADVAMRQGADGLSFAIGLFTAASSQGSLTYWLTPTGDAAQSPLSGTWRTTFDVSDTSSAIAGDAALPSGAAAPESFEGWAAAIGLPPDADPDADPDGDGFDNRAEFVAQTDPLDAQSVFRITDWRLLPGPPASLSVAWLGATNRTVLLEWLPADGTAGAWQCIWTSTPLNRVERALPAAIGPNVVEAPPIGHQPGMYRLHVAEPR